MASLLLPSPPLYRTSPQLALSCSRTMIDICLVLPCLVLPSVALRCVAFRCFPSPPFPFLALPCLALPFPSQLNKHNHLQFRYNHTPHHPQPNSQLSSDKLPLPLLPQASLNFLSSTCFNLTALSKHPSQLVSSSFDHRSYTCFHPIPNHLLLAI